MFFHFQIEQKAKIFQGSDQLFQRMYFCIFILNYRRKPFCEINVLEIYIVFLPTLRTSLANSQTLKRNGSPPDLFVGARQFRTTAIRKHVCKELQRNFTITSCNRKISFCVGHFCSNGNLRFERLRCPIVYSRPLAC